MPKRFPSTVFLASTPTEIISALSCIESLQIAEPILFIERNISFGDEILDLLLQTVRRRFPSVRFIQIRVDISIPNRSFIGEPLRLFIHRIESAYHFRKQLDSICQAELGVSLDELSLHLKQVYFTWLNNFVLIFLAACGPAKRIIYPHGLDMPRQQHVREYGYLLGRRSWLTLWRTLSQQFHEFHIGGLFHGLLGFLFPKFRICLPFTGVDQVLTFRDDIDYVPNEVIHVKGLAKTFKWLLSEQPWAGLLEGWQTAFGENSILVLLPECNLNPLWEYNLNFGNAYLKLIQAVVTKTGSQKILIKAHPRSDGTAACWLLKFLNAQEKDWQIKMMPIALSGIPVEALVLTGLFNAACSLGSCSLPPGLGFGFPHYVNESASALFDKGWLQPFLVSYAKGAQMLIQEGICEEISNLEGRRI